MRECPFCSEMIPSDVKICPICGEDLQSVEMIECPICGELIEKGTSICPYCQEKILVQSKETVDNIAAEEEAKRKAEEEKAAEEARRRVEEERAAEEARRKAEEEKAAEEARRKAEEEKAAEEARRRAEEEKAAEEARRKAEEERAAEEARHKAEEERAAEEVRQPQTLKIEGNNKSKIITVSAIIGVLLIVAGIIIFLLFKNEEKPVPPIVYKKLSPIELTDSVRSRLPEGTAILATIDNGNIHRLYYQTDGQIMLYDAESNTTHEIDIDGIYSGATIKSAKLSPDEKYIMMVAEKGEGMNSALLRLNVMTTNVSEIAFGEVELSGKGYKVTTDGKIYYYDNSGELTTSENVEQTEPTMEDNPAEAPQEIKSKNKAPSSPNKENIKKQKTEPEPEQPQQSQGSGIHLVPIEKMPY